VDDDPTLGAFGVSLLLDGEVTIAGTTLDGLFQLSADGDTLSLLGSGEVTFDQFQPLLTGFDRGDRRSPSPGGNRRLLRGRAAGSRR
jgi:hypothetical protein